jgi:hypothetical protein
LAGISIAGRALFNPDAGQAEGTDAIGDSRQECLVYITSLKIDRAYRLLIQIIREYIRAILVTT